MKITFALMITLFTITSYAEDKVLSREEYIANFEHSRKWDDISCMDIDAETGRIVDLVIYSDGTEPAWGPQTWAKVKVDQKEIFSQTSKITFNKNQDYEFTGDILAHDAAEEWIKKGNNQPYDGPYPLKDGAKIDYEAILYANEINVTAVISGKTYSFKDCQMSLQYLYRLFSKKF